MSSLPAHGRFVHVVLCGRSVTSEAIAVLVTNSPKLMTSHAFLEQVDENTSCEFGSRLKSKFSQRLLFKLENYKRPLLYDRLLKSMRIAQTCCRCGSIDAVFTTKNV